MTLEDAHAIQLLLAELEFPGVFAISVFFAIFKTYGIPSISKLLVATGQLSNSTTSSKRAADTGVIITEMVLNKPSSTRTIDAIARMNFLHDRYIRAGKIHNEDMLYTLSLFALEPIRWTERYEWRSLTDIEKCAMGLFWKDMGEVMHISYDLLQSSQFDWPDGLAWLEELEDWSVRYEKEHMVPASTNFQLAQATFDIALFNVPRILRRMTNNIVIGLLEPRLCTAMMLQRPPVVYGTILRLIVKLRKIALRHLCLPRPSFMSVKWFTASDPCTGRIHFERYIAQPWYIKPSFWARWGLKALVLRIVGGAVPGDPQYCPEGYRISELGPAELKGKGEEEMDATQSELRRRRQADLAGVSA
ncbi:hypothetical protein BDV96DRAFT_647275 [Lophiotrema nucula]|uniref:ER-bound oxygenase mpaB/mpaB'/Rubber oxygenase catalytic domain-containing protein n=1 Tax=Lophiotrema nucula TaxID=690887 RepID=A0A6A5Z514_9PLEO|nr:hypothetical protein BDV96DRAFT_647275 [Lophiotrema nucula]